MKECLLKLQTRSKIVCKYALHWLSVQGKLYIKGAYQYIIIALLLFPIVYFTDKYIEACFQIIALFALRYKFPTTYHAKTTMRCTFLTLTIGYLAIPRILPIHTALFSSIAISFIIAFLSWLAQDTIDKKNKITKLENEVYVFSLYDSTKEEFIAHCLNNGIRQDRIEYVWDILRSQMSFQELTAKYCLEYETIKHDRWKYKKKLLNPIDKKNRKC